MSGAQDNDRLDTSGTIKGAPISPRAAQAASTNGTAEGSIFQFHPSQQLKKKAATPREKTPRNLVFPEPSDALTQIPVTEERAYNGDADQDSMYRRAKQQPVKVPPPARKYLSPRTNDDGSNNGNNRDEAGSPTNDSAAASSHHHSHHQKRPQASSAAAVPPCNLHGKLLFHVSRVAQSIKRSLRVMKQIHKLLSFQQNSAFALILAGLLSECSTPAPRYNVPIGIGIFMNPTSGFDHRMVVSGLCLAILIDFVWLLRPQELGFNGYFQAQYDNFMHACLGICALIKVWLVFSTYFDLGPEPPSGNTEQQGDHQSIDQQPSAQSSSRPHHPVWRHIKFFFPRKTFPRCSHLSFEVLMRTLALIWIHGVCGLALLALGILSAMFYSGKVQFHSMAFGAPLHLMMIFRSATTLASYFVATQHMNYNGCLKLFGCHKLAEYDDDGGSDIALKYNKRWLQRVQRAKALDGLVGVYFLLVFYSAFHSGQFFAGSGLTAVLVLTVLITLVLDFWTPLLIMVVAKCGSMLHTHHKRGTIDVDPYYPNQLEWEEEEDGDDGSASSSDSDAFSSSESSDESDDSSYSSSWSSGSRSSSSGYTTTESRIRRRRRRHRHQQEREKKRLNRRSSSRKSLLRRENSLPIVNADEVFSGGGWGLERGGGGDGGGSGQLAVNSINSGRGSNSARGGGGAGGGVWVRHWHEVSGRSYLVHSITGESVWEIVPTQKNGADRADNSQQQLQSKLSGGQKFPSSSELMPQSLRAGVYPGSGASSARRQFSDRGLASPQPQLSSRSGPSVVVVTATSSPPTSDSEAVVTSVHSARSAGRGSGGGSARLSARRSSSTSPLAPLAAETGSGTRSPTAARSSAAYPRSRTSRTSRATCTGTASSSPPTASNGLNSANLRSVHFYAPVVVVPQPHADEHLARPPFFLGEFVFDSLSLKLYATFRCVQQDAIVPFVKKLKLKEIVGAYASCDNTSHTLERPIAALERELDIRIDDFSEGEKEEEKAGNTTYSNRADSDTNGEGEEDEGSVDEEGCFQSFSCSISCQKANLSGSLEAQPKSPPPSSSIRSNLLLAKQNSKGDRVWAKHTAKERKRANAPWRARAIEKPATHYTPTHEVESMTDAEVTGLTQEQQQRVAEDDVEQVEVVETTMTTTTTTTTTTLPVSPVIAVKRIEITSSTTVVVENENENGGGDVEKKSSSADAKVEVTVAAAATDADAVVEDSSVPPPPPPPLEDEDDFVRIGDVRVNGFVSSSAPSAMTPLESALTASPNLSIKSDQSATSYDSAPYITAIERSVSARPGVTTERPDFSESASTVAAKPAGAGAPRSTPVLERAHTSSELLNVRAREIQSARNANEKGFSAATSPTTSSTAPSFEIESVTLPAKGIKETEIDKTMHTMFAIEVRLQGGLQWIIHKRYSDFRELHDRLKRTNSPVKNLYFPKRHVFRNRHQSVIEQRRNELEKYINEVLEIRPLIRVPLFNFLEVYAHMESYERKLQRHKKELESERMKNLLNPEDLEDFTSAFKRLCSSKYLYHGNAKDEPEGSTASSTTGPAKPNSSPSSPSKEAVVSSSSSSSPVSVASKSAEEPASNSNTILHTAGSQISISRASFRRDILGVFPEMPSSFAMRFMKAVSDRQGADINMDEFLRAVAILRCGVMEDRLMFVFNMCDLDHAGKVQSTGLSNFLVSLHGRQVLERTEYRRLLSDGFDQGRARMSMEEFAKIVPELDACSILVDWMEPFVDILCETADPQLLESQEEFNPVVQQKILANETRFSIKEVSILQDAFNNYRVSGGGDVVDLDTLSSDFPLEMSEERFSRVFSSFGSRANGSDIDVFSFVNALAIACRGTPEEKAKFAFTLFATLSGENFMSRDDLYGMLRLDLAQNSDLEDLVVSFIEENVKVRSNSKSLTASGSLAEILEGRTPSVSGSELGIFVDHLMKRFGQERVISESEEPGADETPILALGLEEFATCAKKENYEMGSLRIMREVAFIDLGLVPADKEEELLIARGCYKPYEPAALVEDDQWFLIEAKWFDHWCKYINLQVDDALPVASSGTTNSSTTLASTNSSKSGTTSTNGSTSSSKEAPIMDSEGNYLRPKCINNYVLLTSERRDRVLKSADDIKLGKHFVVITEQLWMALKLWYGGGPEIRRTVVMPSSGVPILDIWEDALKKKKGDDDDDDSTSPSDDEKRNKKNQLALPRRMRSGGSVGLSNLGNTCYMNSALQCLSNTQLLAEYFLSGMYLDDINRTSTLGLQGKLAEVFGKLAEDMWCAKQKSISPRNFKKTIGKFNEAFRGSDQQDSQELLAFLLSGLSEDLNRITEKPYVDQPDSDGRYDADLADEWWRNHLRREVSIIVALFTGQYKSLLTCSVCGFKSARFEPFTFLQVPLPEPTHNTVSVLLVLANGMTPMKVSVRLAISATIFDLKHELMNLCHDEFDLPNISEADIKLCEFSGSMILSFKADNRRIGQIRSIDRLVAFQLETLDTDTAQATRHRRPSYIPTGPGASRAEEMEAEKNQKFYEQLTKGTLVEVRTRAQSHDFVPGIVIDCPQNPTDYNEEEPLILVRLRRGDDEMKVSLNRLRPRQARLLYVPLVSRKLSYSPVYFKNPFRPMPFGIPNLVRICPERTTGYDLYKMVWERVKDYVKAPAPKVWDEKELANKNALVSNHIDDIFSGLNSSSGFLLRRVENKGLTDARSSWLTRSFGYTIPCTNELLDILEEETIAIDWDLQVFQDRVLIDRMKHVESHSSVAKNEAIDKGPVPLKHCLDAFTSEEKISEGYCSSCRTHVEMTKKLEIWRLPPVMVVHLKRFQYTQTYRRKLASLVEFPIEGLDLSCCVAPHEEFPEKYPLKKPKEESAKAAAATTSAAKANGSTAGENGSSAAASDSSTTKPDAGKPTVTFAKSADESSKTNVINRVRRGYTNTNLDQSRCLETNYDLYGVVNHQGALGGGHYTAYAKNFLDDQWYYYDDERVRVVEETRVVSPSAYLLFYLRSDMKGMLVKDMYPQNKKGKITDEDIDRFVDEGDERRCQIM